MWLPEKDRKKDGARPSRRWVWRRSRPALCVTRSAHLPAENGVVAQLIPAALHQMRSACWSIPRLLSDERLSAASAGSDGRVWSFTSSSDSAGAAANSASVFRRQYRPRSAAEGRCFRGPCTHTGGPSSSAVRARLCCLCACERAWRTLFMVSSQPRFVPRGAVRDSGLQMGGSGGPRGSPGNQQQSHLPGSAAGNEPGWGPPIAAARACSVRCWWRRCAEGERRDSTT